MMPPFIKRIQILGKVIWEGIRNLKTHLSEWWAWESEYDKLVRNAKRRSKSQQEANSMGKIVKYKCEVCENETTDYYAEAGWIIIQNNIGDLYFNITKTLGREQQRGAAQTFHKKINQNMLLFCSEKHLVHWIQNLYFN